MSLNHAHSAEGWQGLGVRRGGFLCTAGGAMQGLDFTVQKKKQSKRGTGGRVMTSQEAIELLDNLVGMVEDNQESDYDDALKMAIEALRTIEKQQHDGCLNCDHFDVVKQIQWERDMAIEQLKELGYGLGEKIRTDKDTISRQDAMYIKVSHGINEDGIIYVPLVEVINHLKNLPSAQRKGKWIAERYMDEVDSCFYTRYKCSECGRIVYDSSLSYCHCGAEMKGEEDERIKNS